MAVGRALASATHQSGSTRHHSTLDAFQKGHQTNGPPWRPWDHTVDTSPDVATEWTTRRMPLPIEQSHVPSQTRPAPAPTRLTPLSRRTSTYHHRLPIHPTTSSIVTAAPPHLIVLRILGCGFTA